MIRMLFAKDQLNEKHLKRLDSIMLSLNGWRMGGFQQRAIDKRQLNNFQIVPIWRVQTRLKIKI